MIAIKAEIDAVGAGTWPAGDNPLANAPHPAADVAADNWTHPYPRSIAGWPGGGTDRLGKYWPPVSRIDGAYGDRNVMCSCPPVDAFAEGSARQTLRAAEAPSVVSAPMPERAEDPTARRARPRGGTRPLALNVARSSWPRPADWSSPCWPSSRTSTICRRGGSA